LAGAVAGWPLAWLASRLAGAPCPSRWTALAAAGSCALAATTAFGPVDAIVSGGLALALVLLAAVDLLDWRLPDIVTLPLLLVGLVNAALTAHHLLDHLLGALFGYLALAGISLAFERVARRSGLGLGDAKLIAAAGAWMGWAVLPQVLLAACGLGLGWGGVRIVLAGKEGEQGGGTCGQLTSTALCDRVRRGVTL
jgi:leader peptidase (prepilin peptidase) / N-methyltransferase